MKGLVVVIIAFVFLPGSVYMLLASNFGALKGYLIAGTAFFGFLVMLSAVWLFGIPGTTPLTGPKGTQPSFKFFTVNDAAASTYDSVRDFQGGAGNGWQAAPEGDVEEGSPEANLKADLDTARQTAVQDLIEETNAKVEDSSEELDVTNLDAKTYYTIQDGRLARGVQVGLELRLGAALGDLALGGRLPAVPGPALEVAHAVIGAGRGVVDGEELEARLGALGAGERRGPGDAEQPHRRQHDQEAEEGGAGDQIAPERPEVRGQQHEHRPRQEHEGDDNDQ